MIRATGPVEEAHPRVLKATSASGQWSGCTTRALSLDQFHPGSVPQLRKYAESKGLSFKFPLTLDNVLATQNPTGHHQTCLGSSLALEGSKSKYTSGEGATRTCEAHDKCHLQEGRSLLPKRTTSDEIYERRIPRDVFINSVKANTIKKSLLQKTVQMTWSQDLCHSLSGNSRMRL